MRGFLGNGVSSGAIETFSRILAGELGPSAPLRPSTATAPRWPATRSTSNKAWLWP